MKFVMNLNTNGKEDENGCNIFGKYYMRNGEWWLQPYKFDDEEDCWKPDLSQEASYLCLKPTNSAYILDKTVINYGGDSETDETVW